VTTGLDDETKARTTAVWNLNAPLARRQFLDSCGGERLLPNLYQGCHSGKRTLSNKWVNVFGMK
jgi:hypothetical protein